MKTSSKKTKAKFWISLIAASVLAMATTILLVFSPSKDPKTKKVATPKVEAVSKGPTISEDSLKREWEREDSIKREWVRELEQEREGYAKEQARFAKVLSEASDEELFIVLNYAIANHFVPNRDIDPYYDIHVMVGCWKRSLMVYRNLSDRKDLLKKIYPDLKVLDEYVNWGRHGEPYPNDKVAQTILNNVQQESRKMDDKLWSKYFGTPLMRY